MIEFKNIRKVFNNKEILKGINLTIDKGELVVLVGSSGCGKTTTLKMINKLILPTEGKIFINGEDISKKDTIELRRNIGYIIQQTGLFPHMTVGQNIGLVPYLKKTDKKEVEVKIRSLLELVGMNPDEYINRYPYELSGGQQQRIGVARAFASDADIILMDEPFSALDPITKGQLQDELFNLQQQLRKTIIFVTHDMDEALKLGDKICIMKDGEILQFDTPEKILKNPAHEFVEEFIGKNRIWNRPELIRAQDIMIKDPIKTTEERTIVQAVEMMRNNKVDSLMVVEKDLTLKGIVTQEKLKNNLDRNLKIRDIMDTDFSYLKENDSIIDIIKIMNTREIHYIPVINDAAKLIGLITKSSLLGVFYSQYIDEEVGA